MYEAMYILVLYSVRTTLALKFLHHFHSETINKNIFLIYVYSVCFCVMLFVIRVENIDCCDKERLVYGDREETICNTSL